MTLVRFRIREGDGTLVGGDNRTPGSVFAAPNRRHADDDGLVLPVPFQIALDGTAIIVEVAPTSPDWIWKFREEVGGVGVTRYCTVAGATADYELLPDVDPATLDPLAIPEAAWWAAVEGVTGDSGSATAAALAAAASATSAATSQSSATGSASTASSGAATATTKAADATTAAASASGSSGSASGSATSATGSASAAATSAAAALASQGAAGTSASGAAGSATGAAGSQASIASTVGGMAIVATSGTLADPNLLFTVLDSTAHRSWLEVDAAGHPTVNSAALIDAAIAALTTARIATATAALPIAQSISEGPGLAYVVVDSAGHKSELQIDLSGKIVGPFVDRVSGIAAVAGAAAAATVINTAGPPVTCWGDSMTAAGSGYSDLLAAELGGAAVQAFAIGGQGSQQIAARQGGFPALCKLPSDTIPASGPVTLTSISTNLYSNTSSVGTVTGHGTLAGIPGVLSRTYPGTTFIFTRDTAGTATWCPPTAPWISDISLANRGYITVIWSGRNSVDDTSATDLIYLIQMMVNYLTSASKRFLIVEITPLSSETIGTAERTTLNTFNALLQKTFPDSFVPVGQYAIGPMLADSGLTPTSQDTTDLANGVTPISLRNDTTHFNLTGRTLVARMISNTIKAKGWV